MRSDVDCQAGRLSECALLPSLPHLLPHNLPQSPRTKTSIRVQAKHARLVRQRSFGSEGEAELEGGKEGGREEGREGGREGE